MGISYNPRQMQVTTRNSVIFDEHCNINPPSSDPDLFISTGSGQSATTVSGTNGSYYEFASGTTANAETILLFKRSFGVGAKVQIFCDRSSAAGVANQETFIELVEVDPALLQSNPSTAVITSGTDVRTNNARNAYQINWPAASSTVQVWSRRPGSPSIQNANPDITGAALSASIGTSPNFLPGNCYLLKISNEGVAASAPNRVNSTTFAPTVVVSSGNTAVATTAALYSPVDTSKRYALRIRIKNGGTAPASSVITRVYRVIITEDSPLSADLFSGGTTPFASNNPDLNSGAYNALPVRITQGNSTGVSTLIAGSSVTLNTNALPAFNTTAGVISSETALGVAGVYTTGTVNFSSTTSGNIKFHVVSDQASATDGVVIECSNSTATNWRVLAKGTLVADTPLILTAPLAPITTAGNFFSRYRARVINGGVAQTNFSAVFYGGVTY